MIKDPAPLSLFSTTSVIFSLSAMPRTICSMLLLNSSKTSFFFAWTSWLNCWTLRWYSTILRRKDSSFFFYLLEVFFLLIDELLADFDVLRQRILDLLAGLGAIQNLLGLDDADLQLSPPRRHPHRHCEREHRAQNPDSLLHLRVPSIY